MRCPLRSIQRLVLVWIALLTTYPSVLIAQVHPLPEEVRGVLDGMRREWPTEASRVSLPDFGKLTWWTEHVTTPHRSDAHPQPVSLHDVLYMALLTSEQIKVSSEVPLIRETAICEAAAAFDWTRFAETYWNDTSEPVGSTLTVGGAGNRFNDHRWTGAAGARRRTSSGGEFDISQRIGWQNNNSNFFIPSNQATAQLSLGFTQPLMRGRGKSYNQSLMVLAHIDVDVAKHEFSRQLQSHLLEITRAYWALYLERATLAQRVRLYQATRGIHDQIEGRQIVDGQQTQLISARAALESRRTELIRARAAVMNAETRLRALCNHPNLGSSEAIEIIPVDDLTFVPYDTDLENERSTAVQHRPEIAATIKEIRAASIRLNMAHNELLPQLNLVTRAYVSGLQGQSDFGQAFSDQFSRGAPSYSVGLVYELPFGNRAANARLNRRQLEVRQIQARYRSTLETINAEVDIAVRELHTAYDELGAKSRTLAAANAEAEALRSRWKMAPGLNGTASLTLESLLQAQQRITDAENSLVTSQLTYCLAIANLRRANGTLLVVENISLGRACEAGLPMTLLDKDGPAVNR